MDKAKNWWKNSPDRAIQVGAIGQLLGQMGAGAAPNISPAIALLDERRQQRATSAQQAAMQAEFAGMAPNAANTGLFSAEEQAILAQLPPAAAEKIILNRMKAQFAPSEPVKGVVVDGKLRNPITGELIGEYGSDEIEREIITGADGYKYYTDGTRVLPNVVVAPDPGYTVLTPAEVAAAGLNPENAYQRSPDGKVSQIGGGGVTITNNMASEVGTIPQGYELVTDPVTGARSLQIIPGGPADQEAQAEVNRGEKATNAVDIKTDTVVNAALRAIQAAESRAVGGVAGQVASMNPSSQNAEAYRQTEVLKGMIGFETLNQMRQSSPTGGALGNVTERELGLLQSQMGALDPASPNFERDLRDVTKTLLRTIHGPQEGDRVYSEAFGQGAEAGSFDFGSMSFDELSKFDTSQITTQAQVDAFIRALEEAD